MEIFQEELEILREKNTKVISERQKQLEEFEEILNEDINFEGAKLNFKDIPTTIEPAMLEVFILADLIIDEDE